MTALTDERLEEMARKLVEGYLETTTKAYKTGVLPMENDVVRPTYEALKSVRDERIAAVLPSDDEAKDYFQWSKDVKVTTPIQAMEVLAWLRANVKVAVVPDVSDEELREMAQKFAPLDEYPNTHWRREGFRSGFRAAIKLVKGDGSSEVELKNQHGATVKVRLDK